MHHGTLLIVDDDQSIREAIADFLSGLGHTVETAASAHEACAKISCRRFDVVLCDVNLGEQDGFVVLQFARAEAPDAAVILMTGFGTIENAVDAIRDGAFDYLSKPLVDEELSLCIQRALGQHRIIEENKQLRAQLDQRFGLGNIIGRDYKMVKMFDLIESVADTRTTVLILGESGTGKTLTARAIHQLSARRDKPFVEVACGALPDTLLESELFGHVAGSFTGAVHDKVGKFLQADGGTIFLDEIGTASPSLQVKLLRVLQDREFEPVGGSKTHKVDIRLILATNADLEEKVRKGEFRQDLYYRVNVITLTQPPLRERIGDIPILLQHYLEDYRKQHGKQVTGFGESAMQMLQRYNWPGNVRELVNVVERAVVLCKRPLIGIEDLPEALRRGAVIPEVLQARAGQANLKAAMASPERQIILDALESNGWNRQNTAEMLGINRTTLYKKMKKLGIQFEHEPV
jgi:DNA-binding NtrC family response regulator